MRGEPGQLVLENLRRPARRARRYPIRCRLLGAVAAPRFSKAGWIGCLGFPLPHVTNLGGRIEVGNCLFYPGVRLEVGFGARLQIGTGTYLNRNTEVVAWDQVSIGRHCMIGWDVLIMDTDQHPLPGRELDNRRVSIRDRVWIGERAMILKGVTTGDDAIIGAGAIVTHDVPRGAVVTGPAATIRARLAPAASRYMDRDPY